MARLDSRSRRYLSKRVVLCICTSAPSGIRDRHIWIDTSLILSRRTWGHIAREPMFKDAEYRVSGDFNKLVVRK